MGLYIKGVSGLPSGCGQCVFVKQRETSLGTFGDCPFLGTVIGPNRECIYKRHDDCPLVELPSKHGRLIDCDALMAKESAQYENVMKDGQRDWFEKCVADLIHKTLEVTLTEKNAPTVLEAEGVENDD